MVGVLQGFARVLEGFYTVVNGCDGVLLKGSWDLVTRVTNKVTILIIAYNPNIRGLVALLTKSPDPPSINGP